MKQVQVSIIYIKSELSQSKFCTLLVQFVFFLETELTFSIIDHSPVFVKNSYDVINYLHDSILIYPEAEFSFDGGPNQIAPQFGKFIKLINANVLMLSTKGVYAHKAMYNLLNNKTKFTASLDVLLTKQQVISKTADEIQKDVCNRFDEFNYYQDITDLDIKLKSKNRADKLERIIYKCPNCLMEGTMEGTKDIIECKKCGKKYLYTAKGELIDAENDNKINILDWCRFERNKVREEIQNGTYKQIIKVKIYAFKNYDCIYDINEIGILIIDKDNLNLKWKNKHINVDLTNSYDILVKSNFLIFGPSLLFKKDDVRYLCSAIDLNSNFYKIKIAVQEAYKIRNSKIN